MNSDRWRQVEELYRAARDPQKRAGVLAAADPELRSEVEALLAQDDGGSTVTQVGVGMQLGSYRIEAPLGSCPTERASYICRAKVGLRTSGY